MTATLQLAREAHGPHGLSAELAAAVRANDARLVGELRRWFFAPPPTHKPSEWLEQNIILDIKAAPKKPWTFENREYLREQIDDIQHPACRKISVCAGTGSAKTVGDYGIALHEMYWNPFSGLYVMPATTGPGGATAICRELSATLQASPVFAARLPRGAALKTGLTRTHIEFGGNDLDFVGAHSANQLGNKRCRIVFIGEQDKTKEAIGREAGTDTLAVERTKGMANTLQKRGSTPSLEGYGIWTQLLGNGPNSGSDCRRRFLPCPSCGNGKTHNRGRVLPRERTLEILRKHGCAEKIDQAMNWQQETE